MLENSSTNLNKAIVSTIAFFDVFSYPLSAFEVFAKTTMPLVGRSKR
jgi:hypothetical protein